MHGPRASLTIPRARGTWLKGRESLYLKGARVFFDFNFSCYVPLILWANHFTYIISSNSLNPVSWILLLFPLYKGGNRSLVSLLRDGAGFQSRLTVYRPWPLSYYSMATISGKLTKNQWKLKLIIIHNHFTCKGRDAI